VFGVLIMNKLLYIKWKTCVYCVGAQFSLEDVVDDDDGDESNGFFLILFLLIQLLMLQFLEGCLVFLW
jgi:hypothetical protein